MEFEYISDSATITRKLGKNFSHFLDKGDTVLLSGELGGGKTTFINGIAKGLHTKQPVSSPSFTLINIYDCEKDLKTIKIIHCDLYRIDEINDISDIGLEDYIYNEDYVTLIEWAGKLRDGILKDYLEISFEYLLDEDNRHDSLSLENQRRKITFKSQNEYWNKKLNLWIEDLKDLHEDTLC